MQVSVDSEVNSNSSTARVPWAGKEATEATAKAGSVRLTAADMARVVVADGDRSMVPISPHDPPKSFSTPRSTYGFARGATLYYDTTLLIISAGRLREKGKIGGSLAPLAHKEGYSASFAAKQRTTLRAGIGICGTR